MTRQRRSFDPSFKLEVDKMIKEQGLSVQHVCQSMSIVPSAVRRSVAQYDSLHHRVKRQANKALWTIAMVRMRGEPRTRAYVARRSAEGMSNKEIHRCLKRYIARELYPLILADLAGTAEVS